MTLLKALLLGLSFIVVSTIGVAFVAFTTAHEAASSDSATSVKAPEIDAASGVQAIALLSGILLLVGERSRRRNF